MGIGAGVLYLGIWLYQAGISLPLILFLFASCFVCMTGSSEFSPKGLVTLGFSYGWTMTMTTRSGNIGDTQLLSDLDT